MDPPDSDAGDQIRFWFLVFLDEWLWDYSNLEQWYLGLFPASHQRIFINCLLTKSWIQKNYSLTLLRDISPRWGAVCSLLDNMDTRFSQKLYLGDYLFVYAFYKNNVVVLIHTTPEIADTPEADIPYKEVVDTMVDDILDELE